MCSIWAIDGTFDVVTRLYLQLFTIHGITNDGWIFPMVFAFLPNKNYQSYKYVFDKLAERRGLPLNPDIIVMDFEQSEIKAATECYPAAILQACHFHFTQSLYRHFSPIMKKMYEEDNHFALTMKKIFGLAFVKPEDVRHAFNNVKFGAVYDAPLKDDLAIFYICGIYVHWDCLRSSIISHRILECESTGVGRRLPNQ